jgi:hypothetical protein
MFPAELAVNPAISRFRWRNKKKSLGAPSRDKTVIFSLLYLNGEAPGRRQRRQRARANRRAVSELEIESREFGSWMGSGKAGYTTGGIGPEKKEKGK